MAAMPVLKPLHDEAGLTRLVAMPKSTVHRVLSVLVRHEFLAQDPDSRAPLTWDVTDAEPAARAVVALLSDWFPKTTGEIVHVDGGVHAMGS